MIDESYLNKLIQECNELRKKTCFINYTDAVICSLNGLFFSPSLWKNRADRSILIVYVNSLFQGGLNVKIYF